MRSTERTRHRDGKSSTEPSAPAGRTPPRVLLLLVPAAIVLVGLAFWGPLVQRSADFWHDDYSLLTSTYMGLHDFSPTHLLPWVPAHRPLGRNLFAAMVHLFGENPLAFHWLQLGVHCANSVLVWFLVLALTREWLAAFAGSIVFLISLSAYNPITWSSTIFDVASASFLLAAMLMVVHAVGRRQLPRPWLLFGALPVYLLALKTKDSMLVFPAIVLLYFLFHGSLGLALLQYVRKALGRESARLPQPRGKPGVEMLWLVTAGLLTAIFYFTATIHTAASPEASDPYYVAWSLPVSLRSFGFYLSMLFYQHRAFGPWLTAVVILLPVCMAVVIRGRNVIFGLAWYGAFLFPVSLLVNHYGFLHYPYLAVAGVALAVGTLLSRASLPGRIPATVRSALPIVFVLLLIPSAARGVRGYPFVGWFEKVLVENRGMREAMKEALPAPTPGSEILLVVPTQDAFLPPSEVLGVMYGDLSLSGRLFESVEKAREYVGRSATNRPRILATWDDGAFSVRPVGQQPEESG